ncbi:MAG: uracil-DNA glycosylase [Nitrospirae bacterium]|nr:uracil-DNA glycosylase [Nitrospirota bacterium]
MARKNHPLIDLLNTYRALGFDNLPISANWEASPRLEADTSGTQIAGGPPDNLKGQITGIVAAGDKPVAHPGADGQSTGQLNWQHSGQSTGQPNEQSAGQSNQTPGTILHTPPVISQISPQTSPRVSLQEGPQASIVRSRATVEKEKLLVGICEDIGECTRCRLHEQRQHIVFGEGSADTRLMFVGEAPGGDEDVQARPFVGRAGKLLTSLINRLGLSREEVYIANIVKCRPPDNRNPLDDEIATCVGFLERQIDVIKPEVIMSLGNVATKILLKTERGITGVRGKFFDYRGIKVMPTFHPSYLLRDPSKKWLTWDDATTVLKLLGIEVIHPSQNFSTKPSFE